MPRDPSGNYTLPVGNPVITNTNIATSWANQTLVDIASALTQSLSRDGQTIPLSNLPMAGQKHTSVGNASQRNEYVSAGQVQDEALQFCGTATGSANSISLGISPGPPSYTSGSRFKFISIFTNTGATTVNVNGLGVKNLFKYGTEAPLQAGDIVSGAMYSIEYDGVQFLLSAPSLGQPTAADQLFYGSAPGVLTATPFTAAGRALLGSSAAFARSLITVDSFSSSGVWTKPAGCNAVWLLILGATGGAGSAVATSSTTLSAGSGAGGGGAVVDYITSGLGATETVTIGAAGEAVLNQDGTNGGLTSFGGHGQVTGSIAGKKVSGTLGVTFGTDGGNGGVGSGGIINMAGNPGSQAFAVSDLLKAGDGGSGPYGGGAKAAFFNAVGVNGNLNGGGSGAHNSTSQSARIGGNGSSGLIIVAAFT